ncbi:putative DEAD/DEAH box RNA helicase [Planoprotostelium fungivorum]|uniref:Putative DEAD/DEAH box RNA helicase n=1 Tax=Planoprotostelium fungivorum TaxID=1890364 RepID=A0A2P6NBK6_9EUKA|nr:putative DEAD/DEAH box RNA helicase [Planoprotostelium fungivorum]
MQFSADLRLLNGTSAMSGRRAANNGSSRVDVDKVLSEMKVLRSKLSTISPMKSSTGSNRSVHHDTPSISRSPKVDPVELLQRSDLNQSDILTGHMSREFSDGKRKLEGEVSEVIAQQRMKSNIEKGYDEVATELRRLLAEKEMQIRKFEAETEENNQLSRRERAAFKRQQQGLEAERDLLQGEIDRQTKDITRLEGTIRHLTSENTLNQSQRWRNEKEAEMSKTRHELDHVLNRTEENNSVIQDLTTTLQKERKKYEEEVQRADALSGLQAESKKKLEDTEKSHQDLKKETERLTEIVEEQQKQIEQLSTILSVKDSEVSSTTLDLSETVKAQQGLHYQEQFNKSMNKMREMDEHMQAVEEERRLISQACENADETVERLQRQLDALKQEHKDYRRAEATIEKLNESLQSKEDKIASLQAALQTKETAIELNKKVSDGRLEEVLQRIENERRNHLDALFVMGQDNSRLEQAFHRVSGELGRQEEENEVLRKRLAEKEEKTKEGNRARKEAEALKIALKEMEDRMLRESQLREEEDAQTQQLKQDMQMLISEMEEMQRDKMEMTAQEQSLRSEVEELRAENNRLDKKIQDQERASEDIRNGLSIEISRREREVVGKDDELRKRIREHEEELSRRQKEYNMREAEHREELKKITQEMADEIRKREKELREELFRREHDMKEDLVKRLGQKDKDSQEIIRSRERDLTEQIKHAERLLEEERHDMKRKDRDMQERMNQLEREHEKTKQEALIREEDMAKEFQTAAAELAAELSRSSETIEARDLRNREELSRMEESNRQMRARVQDLEGALEQLERDSKEEILVQEQEIALLEREILRLQEMVANSKRDIHATKQPPKTRPASVKTNPLESEQAHLENITSKLISQLGELQKIREVQSQPQKTPTGGVTQPQVRWMTGAHRKTTSALHPETEEKKVERTKKENLMLRAQVYSLMTEKQEKDPRVTSVSHWHKTKKSWEELGLAPWLAKTCRDLGMPKPTPIQELTIPSAHKGDLIGAAPTGSGKTAAFALPIIQTLSQDPYGIYALILAPTRELALQITTSLKALSGPLQLKVATIIGGDGESVSLERKPHIVVATPGRMLKHMEDGLVQMKRLRYLILDEADCMLNGDKMTNTIYEIIKTLPTKRQTFFYSATMKVSEKVLEQIGAPSPERFHVGSDMGTVTTLDQKYLFLSNDVKDCYIVYLVRLQQVLDAEANGEEGNMEEMMKPKKATKPLKKHKKDDFKEMMLTKREREKKQKVFTTIIIFCGSVQDTEKVYHMLDTLGVPSVRLHSRMEPTSRKSAMKQFRGGEARVLVASDIAARGLDIPSVGLVINYTMPSRVDTYIHRVGRTARAGRKGRAVTIINTRDVKQLQQVEETLKIKMEELKLNEEEVLRHMPETAKAKALSEEKIVKKNEELEAEFKGAGLKRKLIHVEDADDE